jgi:tetratricopeptide (TPR) repeat protein
MNKVGLVIVCVAAAARLADAQGTMRRPTPETDTLDSSGNLKKRDAVSSNDGMARGVVVMADGSAPKELVEILGGCGGVQRFLAIADSKGRVGFHLKGLSGGARPTGCAVRASLDGFHSEAKMVPDPTAKVGFQLGKMVLEPLSPDTLSFGSSADEQASKPQKKQFEHALDDAAGQDWPKAIASLSKVTADNPGYSSAWLSLGILRQSDGDRESALKAFLEAVRADPKFALPYIRAAELEAIKGDWTMALEHSQKAIDLNPAAFPAAYAVNAMANVSLQRADLAEKNALEGLKLDTERQYPELEYSLGIVLYSKGDVAGASKHLQNYLHQSPNGSNAAGARTQLAQMEAAAVETVTPPNERGSGTVPSKSAERAVELDAQARLMQERNARLLAETPAHMCLETITRGVVDLRGKLRAEPTMRVDIAVSGDKEIYGYTGGKRFSDEGLASMLGNTFSTTGIFSSLARGLIAWNQVDVQAVGEEVLNGEPVLRYEFRTRPGAAGWFIHYGNQAGRASEEGYFLVERAGLMLRRVSARAVEMPHNLKLKNMRVVIDYEPVTIANRRVLLPEKAEVNVEEASGNHRVSDVFFNHCRLFAAESMVSFDPAERHDGSDSAGKPALPMGLEIEVSLVTPVSVQSASQDDVIAATVTQPVMVKGREMIARGAAVDGHVRPRRGEGAVVIELDRVMTRQGWLPFYARLISAAGADARLEDPEIPGVATVALPAKTGELAAGTRMTWKTEALPVPAETQTPQLSTSVSMR